MLARIFPYAAINYMMYEQFKRLLVAPDARHPEISRLLAGSMAGVTSVLFTYPLDLTRARLAYQVKVHKYQGISHTIATMVREEGWRSLYRGFVPTLLGILPYAGTSFATYDTLKIFLSRRFSDAVLRPHENHKDLRVPYQLACGAIAGAVAQTVSYPLDVVRRRMQLSGMSSRLPNYASTAHAFRSIWQTEGFRGLWIGLSINYVKVVPAVSLSFATYEYMKKALHIE